MTHDTGVLPVGVCLSFLHLFIFFLSQGAWREGAAQDFVDHDMFACMHVILRRERCGWEAASRLRIQDPRPTWGLGRGQKSERQETYMYIKGQAPTGILCTVYMHNMYVESLNRDARMTTY